MEMKKREVLAEKKKRLQVEIQSDTEYVGDFLAVFFDKVHMKEDN